MEKTMVSPCVDILFRSRRTAFAELESELVVGSSRNKRDDTATSSIPVLVLFLSPPDMPRYTEAQPWNLPLQPDLALE